MSDMRADMIERMEYGLALKLAQIRVNQCDRAMASLTAQAEGKESEFWRVVGTRIEPGEKRNPWGLRPLFSNRISRVKKKRVVARWVWP
jgi:hypothetical protein